MIRIDHLLFGYVTFKIAEGDIPTVAGRLMRSGISAKISASGEINVRYSMMKRFKDILSDVEYAVTEPKGLFGFLYKLRKRYGLIAGVLISLALAVLSRTLVWDIRIEGVDKEAREELMTVLSESGLSVGTPWHKIDTASVETKALISSSSVAWLNVNRRGSVAYVTAVPKTVVESEDKSGVFSNIVASRDCVIEKITVKRGIATVKVGQTVKAGDVLISGVIPTELGGGVCYAEGSVIGRFSDGVTHFSSSKETERVYSDTSCVKISVKLFKNEINIFKTYRNFVGNCDIIEKKRQLTLFGVSLPITVFLTERNEYTESERIIDDGTLVKRVAGELSYKIAEMTEDMTLVSIKTDGRFCDGGYLMNAELIVSGEVAKVIEFYRE